MSRWQEEKNKSRMQLKAELARRRAEMTADMWTSSAKGGYMFVTVHYVTKELDVRHCILAFIRVLYSHTGERLADYLVRAVNEMDPSLLFSTWAITADNASSNSTMIDELEISWRTKIWTP
jgi:hypothetical protein